MALVGSSTAKVGWLSTDALGDASYRVLMSARITTASVPCVVCAVCVPLGPTVPGIG